jgi:hypothetical protein
MSSTPKSPELAKTATDTDGNLLLLITAVLYGLFTLLPNSTTQMVTWPWVALWQALVLLPMVWLGWQVWHKPLTQLRLGNGFDWLAGFTVVGLVISTLAANFPQPARWYALAAIAPLAALYALMGWLTPERVGKLLKAQAYLAIAFMVCSLGLWLINTIFPELSRLESFRAIGVHQALDLGVLPLRNGFPLGHQNYVAGYVVLMLPLLVGLALTDKTWQRWVWLVSAGLGGVTLYSTSSRAGVLALTVLVVAAVVGVVLSRPRSKRVVIPVGVFALALLGVLMVTNPRLQGLWGSFRQGSTWKTMDAYRVITHTIGWHMGLERPWTGWGLGSVPLLFQRYRPIWAGREAELHFQLHSTPAQLWAELGLWGIGLPIAAAVLVLYGFWRYRQSPVEPPVSPLLVGMLAAGLGSYSVLSLTDYQLDVIPISGVLIIYLAIILFQLRSVPVVAAADVSPRRRRIGVGVGIGLWLASVIWLIPIHRAWAASSQGFWELQKENYPGFVQYLQRSQRGVPWEAYYPFQLGWAIGDLSLRADDPQVANQARTDAIAWFQQANQVSPYREFGYSNLGWLQAPVDPEAALSAFAQAAQLVPAKMGVFFGLGYSLWLNNQPDAAATAMALEIIRHPRTLTSSIWTLAPFNELYPTVLDRLETLFADLLAATSHTEVTAYLHRVRGTTRWWVNDFEGAAADWERYGTPISRAVLMAAQGDVPDIASLPNQAGKYALQAWQNPPDRTAALTVGWVTQQTDAPVLNTLPTAPQMAALAATMAAASTFDDWIKQTAPTVEVRNERLGFGVFSRHDDGPSPVDYYTRYENIAIAKFFEELVSSPIFMPALDEQLQPYRDELLQPMSDRN